MFAKPKRLVDKTSRLFFLKSIEALFAHNQTFTLPPNLI